ncbi:class I SAM-dependent methyltransferase [Sulfuriflexus sp.]|uniref:class I SAM-dependent methyltransferase n=1 Tax=Sulfuriflexus sp. TaxID=2015443 RepID=UPI0028CC3D6B|nr:class I SAM-dependent methyltransferase [Sulfuriflexus sp.]MDT8403413.1 class I SAM-dependent methyltransferase [Sulfuriflexus sp.]
MPEFNTDISTNPDTEDNLPAWYSSYLGGLLARAEHEAVDTLLPDLFGYHLVQLSGHGESLCENSRISHCVVVNDVAGSETGLLADNAALPFASESVDVVVMPHSLEFHPNPHAILREVDRILIPEGHVVLINFNPFSFWGLARLLSGWRNKIPWRGQYYTRTRLRDWLSLLGFDYISGQQVFFRPPVQHEKIMQKLEFMERLGQRCMPLLAGVSIMLARKRTSTLTPIRSPWRKNIRQQALVEPTARGIHYDDPR